MNAELAAVIQHTLIAADLTADRMAAHAEECVQWGFQAAMVPGSWVREVASVLSGTEVVVASALDFPIVGITTPRGKAAEAEQLVAAGAQQLDIGCQIGWLKSGRFDAFRDDIAGVVTASGVPVKVMLELPLLTAAEREAAVELAMEAGAAYLKNASSGAVEIANVASIAWLSSRVRDGVLVKASGGITSAHQVRELIAAGAALVGTSAGIEIVSGSDDTTTRSY
ncbi:deoxyribose-phosphate aldolase [Microcella sp.]|uniref:deoxyribose-phosphate aldolase n=1 Tax=Microcella sp. TaxID=1913979 RepID=UPI00255FA3CB|nr:deoxyribose-phosphate aldolase [Microcella sp.]MBX9471119.1 deoxyribose-phosphate aldolase [Microcella sp.]